jgi:hypothetical protein
MGLEENGGEPGRGSDENTALPNKATSGASMIERNGIPN